MMGRRLRLKRFCTECGKEAGAEDRICVYCGTPLEDAPAAQNELTNRKITLCNVLNYVMQSRNDGLREIKKQQLITLLFFARSYHLFLVP